MALIIRSQMHHELVSRASRDAVPVHCEACDIEFAWPFSRGNPVKCPGCGTEADLELKISEAVAAQILTAQKGAVTGE